MEFVMAKTEHANLDIRVFDKSNPNGICAYLRDPWENKKHPACSLAHCALSCRPQIPQISTDFSHTKSV